jgi:DNA mismatch repair ATPase MutL
MPSTVDKNIWNKRKSSKTKETKQNKTKQNKTKTKAKQKKYKSKTKANQKQTKSKPKANQKQTKSKPKAKTKERQRKNKRKIKLVLLHPLPTRMPLGRGRRTGMNGSRGTAHQPALIYPRPPLLPHGPQRGRHPRCHPLLDRCRPHRQANLVVHYLEVV